MKKENYKKIQVRQVKWMRFIHIADVHWGMKPDRTKPWSKLREKEIKETFKNVLSYADEKKMDLLLISGDFFHEPPSYQEVREIDYLLGKLQKTKVVWIAGNHDYLREDAPLFQYSFSENITFLKGSSVDKIYFPELKTTIYGFSYWSEQMEEPLYNSVKPEEEEGIHILLAHGGDEKHIPINKEVLKWSGFDYIALGHIHAPEVIFDDLMAYAGSLEPLDHTETEEHGFMEGEITEEKKIVSFVPFAKRKYMEVEITVSEDMSGEEIGDRIETEISYRGKEHIYQIVLSGRIDPKISLEMDQLFERYFIFDIRFETKSSWDYDQVSEEDDLLLQKIAELLKDEPKALAYAMEALSASKE